MFIVGKRVKAQTPVNQNFPRKLIIGAPPVIHKEHLKAVEEATRLARENPGYEFLIFQAVNQIECEIPPPPPVVCRVPLAD